MNATAVRFVRIGGSLLALVTAGCILTLQAARPYEHGLRTDWSHQHIIFSQPRTAEQVAQVAHDARYWQQFVRRNVVRVLSLEDGVSHLDPRPPFASTQDPSAASSDGLWSLNMGTGATAGAGNFPTKYSFSSTTATCSNATSPDFVIFNTGLQASATRASIIAYDNLYSGCSVFGTVPTVYWAYNTTLPGPILGTVKTSPITSLDGSQIAFVQTDGTHGYLVLLRWKANNGTLTSPVAPAFKTAANYPGCTAPCMASFPLRTTATGGTQTNDTTSSIFYDYSGDTAYVGDSVGLLHKYHPFFTTGAPGEVGFPWPIQANVASPNALSSPVYDHVTGNVFLGDASGYFARVNATTGTAIVSARIDYGPGISNDGPILDQTAQKVFVFSSSDGTTQCAGAAPCAAVFQFSTGFSAGTSGTETQVGISSATPNFLYAGDFDDAYYTSANQTGNLYVCGNTGANPIMYQVPITAGAMPATGTSLNTVTTTGSTAACSSVTDVFNPNAAGGLQEIIFFSPQNNGRAALCAGKGCVESFIVTSWQASTAISLGHEILSPNGHTEVAIVAGTSAATEPAWGTTTGAILVDGGVTWIDQGHITAVPLGAWAANHAYAFGARILDSNGKVEVVNTAGTSGVAAPGWSTTVGAKTTDGTVKWINTSTLPVNALQITGGASGIIMDNVVSSGTLAGASQVYFSTLKNQACTSGGTGGCAVQASQVGLK